MSPATPPQTRPWVQEVAAPRLPLYLIDWGARFEVDSPAFVALRPDRAPPTGRLRGRPIEVARSLARLLLLRLEHLEELCERWP
jgi:hypothetical protein